MGIYWWSCYDGLGGGAFDGITIPPLSKKEIMELSQIIKDTKNEKEKEVGLAFLYWTSMEFPQNSMKYPYDNSFGHYKGSKIEGITKDRRGKKIAEYLREIEDFLKSREGLTNKVLPPPPLMPGRIIKGHSSGEDKNHRLEALAPLSTLGISPAQTVVE